MKLAGRAEVADDYLQGMTGARTAGLSELTEALRKIAMGNLSARVPEGNDDEQISELKKALNLAIENLEKMFNKFLNCSMDFAVYFDVLQRVTKGDLDARITGNLPTELSQSLQNLTNEMIESISREISGHKRAQQALERSIEEWRTTFDSMPYGVLVLDLNFRVKKVNRYIKSLYAKHFGRFLDRKCFEIIGSDRLRENYISLTRRNVIGLDAFEFYDTRSGRFFLLSLTPIPDETGLTKFIILSMVDINEMKVKEEELAVSYKKLNELFGGLIHSFGNAIDAKSAWTKGHSERVTDYSLAIAEEMGMDEEFRSTLATASLLHDIGKIGTNDLILDKPRELTSAEFDLINKHPLGGVEILRPIRQLEHLLPIIRHHHERVDGTGYPDGLKGEEIPLMSRIICVADAYDSMTSDRPYRGALGNEHAISELKKYSGTQFDPEVVEAFLRAMQKREKRR